MGYIFIRLPGIPIHSGMSVPVPGYQVLTTIVPTRDPSPRMIYLVPGTQNSALVDEFLAVTETAFCHSLTYSEHKYGQYLVSCKSLCPCIYQYCRFQ